jgi:hypothetical protein
MDLIPGKHHGKTKFIKLNIMKNSEKEIHNQEKG